MPSQNRTFPSIALVGLPSLRNIYTQSSLVRTDEKGARGYVQPNQCFKHTIAFVTHPRVTNVIVLEKFRIGGDAQ